MGGSAHERHSDEEYLDAVRQYEPAATSEVATAVGVARQSADYRLRQLKAEGLVESKKIQYLTSPPDLRASERR